MSNAYINQILFKNTKHSITEEYVKTLFPLMLTEAFLQNCNSILPTTEVVNSVVVQETKIAAPPTRFDRTGRTIFWSIYENENPSKVFLQTRANTEIEHRIKVVDALKKTPKRLKETNAKLTLEQTQALFGTMLTAKEDRLEFCVAYAAYYGKPIVVVYQKSYTVFSPTVDVDLSEESIVLHASKPDGARSVSYVSDKSQTTIAEIIQSKIAGPLKSMSTYKTAELDDIALKLNIPTKHSDNGKEKRRKKEDIYNEIRVAIHNDTNFTKIPNSTQN